MRRIDTHSHITNEWKDGAESSDGHRHHAKEIAPVTWIRYIQFRRGSIHLHDPAS